MRATNVSPILFGRLPLGTALIVAGWASAAGAAAEERAPAPAPGAAQEIAAGDEAVKDDLGGELRRILVLRNGQTIRAVARLRDGAWEHKTEGGGWATLEARLVARAALEKDVLSEMRAREDKLGSNPGERVAFAGWLAESGLVQEALEQLDRVLQSRPHERSALELLANRRWVHVPSLSVPPEELAQAREELLTFGAKAPRAVRELAIVELARCEDRAALQAELATELRADSLRRRSFAAQALGRLFPGEEPKQLLTHAVLDTSEEVRREACFALGASEEPGMIVPVVRALNSANPRIRTQAAEALGNMGYPAAIEPLVSRLATVAAQSVGGVRVPHSNIFIGRQFAYIQDFDVEVAQFQAVADPQVNVLIEGSVLDAGVQGTQHYAFAYESKVIRGSLGDLTGENPGYTSKAWLDWWEDNQARWRTAEESATAAATPSSGN